MSDEAEGTVEPQLDREGVWSARAASLLAFVLQTKPPVKRSTIGVWAQRKGWEPKTLEACLDYCVETKLLTAYKSFSGEVAWKVPLTPVHEEGESTPSFDEALKAPERKSKPAVTGDWIDSNEAAELLGRTPHSARRLYFEGKIVGKKDDTYAGAGRKPLLFRRSSVIALRDARSKGNVDLLDVKKTSTATRPKKSSPKSELALMLPRTAAVLTTVEPSIIDDVRALHGMVKRGGMDTGVAWSTLCKLLGVSDIDWMTLCNLFGVS